MYDIVVVGGGPAGVTAALRARELAASVFEDFGASVTILEVAPRILLTEDADVSAEIGRQFERRDIQVRTGIGGVERIDRRRARLTVSYTDAGGEKQTLDVDVVLAAVGWPGDIDHLALDRAGVQTEGSFAVVDDYLRTSAPHIYAAGDVTGRRMLVQSVGYQARIAVENALLPFTQKAEQRLVPHGGVHRPRVRRRRPQ